jgi:hypothetical protein
MPDEAQENPQTCVGLERIKAFSSLLSDCARLSLMHGHGTARHRTMSHCDKNWHECCSQDEARLNPPPLYAKFL